MQTFHFLGRYGPGISCSGLLLLIVFHPAFARAVVLRCPRLTRASLISVTLIINAVPQS
jgi:hypothetical protein